MTDVLLSGIVVCELRHVVVSLREVGFYANPLRRISEYIAGATA